MHTQFNPTLQGQFSESSNKLEHYEYTLAQQFERFNSNGNEYWLRELYTARLMLTINHFMKYSA